MTTYPIPLTTLLDEAARAELTATYGPLWRIVPVNGGYAVAAPPPDWAAMTQAERERGRREIMVYWGDKLRISEDGGQGVLL